MEEVASPKGVMLERFSKSGTQKSGISVRVDGSRCVVGELDAKEKLVVSRPGGENDGGENDSGGGGGSAGCSTMSAAGEAKAMDGERP